MHRRWKALACGLVSFLFFLASGCRGKSTSTLPTQVDLPTLHAKYGQALYSQDDEETLIRAFFEDRRGGVFLDVGAGDPIRNSTTYYLEKHLGWRGVAVDALAEYSAAYLRQRPGTRFFAYFAGRKSGENRDFHAAEKLDYSSAGASDPRGGSYLPRRVPSITLDDLLTKEKISRLDFLSMDIEGGEPEALAGFSIDCYRPLLVCIEINSPEHGRGITEYFTLHGYREILAFRTIDPINRYYARLP